MFHFARPIMSPHKITPFSLSQSCHSKITSSDHLFLSHSIDQSQLALLPPGNFPSLHHDFISCCDVVEYTCITGCFNKLEFHQLFVCSGIKDWMLFQLKVRQHNLDRLSDQASCYHHEIHSS